MGLQLKMPSAPPLPKMGGGQGGEGGRTGMRPLWKVLLPLLLLLIPLGLYIGASYAPVNWRYWLHLAAWILAGLIVLWVLVRLFLYLRERWLLNRQRSFLKRQDPLFVASAKIENRVKLVLEKLKAANLGTYGLPWYAVLGPNLEEVEAVLSATGLDFPKGAAEGLNLSPEQADRWLLANDAVFLDVSAGRFDKQGEKQRKVIWSVLSKLRPKESLSGALLILRVDELADDDEEARDARLDAVLDSLRNMQEGLRLNFPVYLLITGVERVPGFEEFFSTMLPEDRGQILGWSELGGLGREFDLENFRKGLVDLKKSLHNHMMRHLAEPQSSKAAGRVFIFADELDGLFDRLRTAVEAVFAPNRYLDSLPLRGAYLVGAGAEGPMVSFRPGGVPAGMAAEVGMVAGGAAAGDWFTRDLLKSKVLMERGMTTRPGYALRRNILLKGATVFLVLCVASGAAWWMKHTTDQAEALNQNLAPLMQTAGDAIANNDAPVDPLNLGRGIMNACLHLEHASLSENIVGLGRYRSLEYQLRQIHRAVFQEFYFKNYLVSVRDSLSSWAGEGSFQAFAMALAEYIQWTNPTRQTNSGLDLQPLVDFMGAGEAEREDVFGQFDFFMAEGGPVGSMVATGERDLMLGILDRVQTYLNPSLPDQASGEVWNRESQWWLEFSMGLSSLTRAYNSILAMESPDDKAPFEQAQAAYENLVDSLASFLNQADRLHTLVLEAAKEDAGWIPTQKIFNSLRESARGWEPVERGVEKVRAAGNIYRRRIVAPLANHLYAVQFLYGRPGFGWLQQVLSGSFDGKAEKILEPAHQVGPFVLALFKALGEYHHRVDVWVNGFETWKSQISTFQNISQPARIIRLDERQMLKAEDRVSQVLREMEILAGRKQNLPAAQNQGAAGNTASKGNKKSKKQPDMVLEQVLALYNWRTLDKRVKQWDGLIRRVSLYNTSLYWRELANKFQFAKDIAGAADWADFKREPVFALGDGESLVEPIGQFLRDWERELPQALLNLASGGAKTPVPPELSDFVDMHKEMMTFRDRYLPTLRRAAINFVRCVHDMDLNPSKAWQQIWKSQGPGASGQDTVTWGNLEALSFFRDAFEAKEGPVLENFTRPLVMLQNSITDAFQRDLMASFEQNWNQLIGRYGKLGYAEAFPFYLHGKREVGLQNLLDFFGKLESLGGGYSLLNTADQKAAKAVKLYPVAGKILNKFKENGRLDFIQSCLALKAYLEERDLKKPRSIQARLVPGEIGRHLHWVRIALGTGANYDLNVYGKPVVTIPMPASVGSVTMQGLDVKKDPLTSTVATRGEMALLQLPYLLGGTKDPQRRKWLLEGQLPSVASPGEMVPYQIEMNFSQPLPELPRWPKEVQ